MSKQKTQNEKQVENITEIKKLPFWGVALFGVATTLIFFWSQLAGSAWFWEDFVEYVLPIQVFAAREFAAGTVPFWNPYSFAGMPFLADVQVGFFYPLNRIFTLFTGSEENVSVWTLQFAVIFHFFISQINMYLFTRSLKISSYGSLISAVTYTFSLLMVCHVIHPMMVYHLVWLPLIFMFFRKGILNARYDYAIASGLILGFTLLAGHPQTTLYVYLLLGMYLLYEVIIMAKEKSKSIITGIICGAITFAIGAGLFMVQYIPSQELADYSVRAEMSYEKSSEGSLEFKQTLTAIIPYLFGSINGNNTQSIPFYMTLDGLPATYYYYWETAFYFGIVGLFLGIFALLNLKQLVEKRFALFLVLALSFAYLYALGNNFFLHGLFYNFPLFNAFRIPARILFYLIFAFSILAAMGFDKLFISVMQKKALKNTYIAFGIIALFALLGVVGIWASLAGAEGDISSKLTNMSLIALLLASASFAIAYFSIKNKLAPSIAGLAFAIIAFFDLYGFGADFNKSEQNPMDKYTISNELKDTFKPTNIDSLYRVATRIYSPSVMAMNRNQGMIDKIMLIEGYNPLILSRLNPPYENIDDIYRMQNVRYQLVMDAQSQRPFFRENQDYLPRTWAVSEVLVMDSVQMVEAFRKKSFNPLETALIEKSIEFQNSSIDEFEYDIKTLQYDLNSSKYKVNTSSEAVLCLSEIWYPAWKVYVNDKEQELLRVNYSFRGVVVPKGESIVTFKYQSRAFSTGLLITAVTLISSLIGLAMIIMVRRKNQ